MVFLSILSRSGRVAARRLDSGAVDRERDVILREMEEVNKQHEELILDLLHEAAYVVGWGGQFSDRRRTSKR